MFSGHCRVSQFDTNAFCKGNIFNGMYEEYDCIVKRLPLTSVRKYFMSLKLQKSCTQQENMVSIMETICYDDYYEIVTEKYDMNLDEFMRDPANLPKFKDILRY